jgi:hypothetical protein
MQAVLRFSSPILGTCRPFQEKAAGYARCIPISRRCRVSRNGASRNGASRTSDGRTALMLGFVAAILFAIAFIINAANVAISNAIFTPTSLMLLGLVCLALHLSGVGTSWKYRR